MNDARLMLVDDRGVIRHWGDELETVYGYSAEETVGRDVNFLIPQPLRSRHWKGFDKALASGALHRERTAHVPALHKDGKVVPVRTQPSLTFDERGQANGASSLCLGLDPSWLVPLYKAGIRALRLYDRVADRRRGQAPRPEPN